MEHQQHREANGLFATIPTLRHLLTF
jgi:hypothetical protein